MEKFKLQLTDKGLETFNKMFKDYEGCEPSDVNCQVINSTQISVEDFKMALTTNGLKVFEPQFKAYNECSSLAGK